jgi:hypothetical protein
LNASFYPSRSFSTLYPSWERLIPAWNARFEGEICYLTIVGIAIEYLFALHLVRTRMTWLLMNILAWAYIRWIPTD